jgi:adenylate kinase family enzyme
MTDFLVHLVCGSTGAGKTTYAEALSKRIGGVRFSFRGCSGAEALAASRGAQSRQRLLRRNLVTP